MRLEVQEFDAQEALSKQLQDINKEFPATVMRSKTIVLDPMTVEEAIDALEAIDHSFYVFREMTSDTVQVGAGWRRAARRCCVCVARL